MVAALVLLTTLAMAADEDPVEVLLRVRGRVLAHGERVPNHTCVESIKRDTFARVAAEAPHSCDDLLGRRKRAGVDALVKLERTDRLRLDVTLAGSREIYSWAGAGKFEEKSLDELVPPGATGTGAFAATILSIFQTRDTEFAFNREKAVNGRRLFEYSYRVSEDASHTLVKAGRNWLVTGYTGTLLVDPATAELVELFDRTEELPRATNLCETDSTFEYGMVRLGADDYLLPKVARERFINQDGSEVENTLTFSACREFRGESTVNFGETSAETPAHSPSHAKPGLPVGLTVTVELAAAIVPETAAAGDAIFGRIAEPVLEREGKRVLAPAGAKVSGRLMRVETRYGHPDIATVAFRWETVEVDGAPLALALMPQRFNAPKTTFLLPRPGEEPCQIEALRPGATVAAGSKGVWFTAPE